MHPSATGTASPRRFQAARSNGCASEVALAKEEEVSGLRETPSLFSRATSVDLPVARSRRRWVLVLVVRAASPTKKRGACHPGRKYGKPVGRPGPSRGASRRRSAAGGRQLRKSGPKGAGAKTMTSSGAPARAAAVGGVADRQDGTAGGGDPLQLPLGEEADGAAVRATRTGRRALGARQRRHREAVRSRANQSCAFRPRRSPRRRASSRRARGRRRFPPVEIHLRRQHRSTAARRPRRRAAAQQTAPANPRAASASAAGPRQPASARRRRDAATGAGDARLRAALRDPLSSLLTSRRVLPAVLRILGEAASARPGRAPAASSARSPRWAPARRS